MTYRLALALAATTLLGCERADHVERDEPFVLDTNPPAVGDVSSAQQLVTIKMQFPDGERVERHDVAYTMTDTVITGEMLSEARMVIERDVHTQDGRSLPGMAGAYVLRAQGGTMVGAHEDGRPLEDHEQKFFAGLLPPVTPADRATMHDRAFHTGDRFTPTAIEMRALGLGSMDKKRDIEVHIVHADTHDIRYDATFELLAKAPVVGKTTVHGTVSHTVLDQSSDTVWVANDKQLGTSHAEVHGQFKPAVAR